MPRFGTKSLLLVFAVAALWLSTFSGYRPAQDVRRSILLLILVASGCVAIYSRGRLRAFWSAYFAVMLFCGGLGLDRPLYRYVPEFTWLQSLSAPVLPPPPQVYSSTGTIIVPTQPSPQTIPKWISAPPTAYAVPTPAYTPAPTFYVLGSTMRDAIGDTISAAWTIALSVIAGFVAAYIYAQMPKSAGDSR